MVFLQALTITLQLSHPQWKHINIINEDGLSAISTTVSAIPVRSITTAIFGLLSITLVAYLKQRAQ